MTRRPLPRRIYSSVLGVDESAWRAVSLPQMAPPTLAPKPPLLDRISDAAWRLHDGMPVVWAAAFAVLLVSSCAASVLLAAALLGWRP